MFGQKSNKTKQAEVIATTLPQKTDERVTYVAQLVNDFTDDAQRKMTLLLKEEGYLTHELNDLLGGTEYTLEEIHQVNEEIQSLVKIAEDTKDSIDGVSESLKVSSEVILDTRKGYQDMSLKMDEVTQVFSEFHSLFEQLQIQYKEIQSFTNMITNVADQTRLLSLNAAIEAARVGAAGVGFAVVANEIKTLSDESQRNAKDIITSLNRMTETIDKLSMKSNDGTKVVDDARRVVEVSEKLIDNIVEAESNVKDRLETVKASQQANVNATLKITANLSNVAQKSGQENEKLNELVTKVYKKTDFYTYILNHLDQVKGMLNLRK